jgi:hypothetical protein
LGIHIEAPQADVFAAGYADGLATRKMNVDK